MAAAYRHIDVVQLLLNAGADPDVKNDVGSTPLHFGALSGCQYVVKKLLNAGANPDQENFEGESPLHLAKEYGNKKNVVKLLKKRK